MFIGENLKVGQTVFVLSYDTQDGIEESKVKSIKAVKRNGEWTLRVHVPCVYDDWGGAYYKLFSEDFGKRAFLTREEAEAELKKLRAEGRFYGAFSR